LIPYVYWIGNRGRAELPAVDRGVRDLAVAELRAAELKSTEAHEQVSHLHEARRVVGKAMALPLCKKKPAYAMLATALLSRICKFEGGEVNRKDSRKFAEQAHAMGVDKKVRPRFLSEAQITLAEDLMESDNLADLTRAIRLLTDAVESCSANAAVLFACHLDLTDLYLKLGDIQNALLSFAEWDGRSTTIEYDSLKKKALLVRDRVNRCKYFLVREDDIRKIDDINGCLAQFMIDREKRRIPYTPLRAAENIGIDVRTLEEWERKITAGKRIKFQLREPHK